MKNYELTVVFHPDLEMNLDPALDKVKKAIDQAGGTITKDQNDGKKRLAYTIKGQDYGLYYLFDVVLPPESPSKLSAIFAITDEILRDLLVKADPNHTRPADEERSSEKDQKEEA